MSAAARLPDTLSALIRVAVHDAQAAEASGGYVLDMWRWHGPPREVTDNGPCLVCMAGAVMAMTLGRDPSEVLTPEDVPAHENKLRAIDEVRTGDIKSALEWLDVGLLRGAELDAVLRAEGLIGSEYDDDDGRAHWGVYIEAAEMLERVGL